jgi:hypothetical protein
MKHKSILKKKKKRILSDIYINFEIKILLNLEKKQNKIPQMQVKNNNFQIGRAIKEGVFFIFCVVYQ